MVNLGQQQEAYDEILRYCAMSQETLRLAIGEAVIAELYARAKVLIEIHEAITGAAKVVELKRRPDAAAE